MGGSDQPAVACYLVEPQGAAALDGQPVVDANHPIQGGGYSMANLPLLDPDHVDGYLQVSTEDAIHMARRLAREEGIFAGFSSGANAAAAVQLLTSMHPGATAVILMCDSGLKYLSTQLYSGP